MLSSRSEAAAAQMLRCWISRVKRPCAVPRESRTDVAGPAAVDSDRGRTQPAAGPRVSPFPGSTSAREAERLAPFQRGRSAEQSTAANGAGFRPRARTCPRRLSGREGKCEVASSLPGQGGLPKLFPTIGGSRARTPVKNDHQFVAPHVAVEDHLSPGWSSHRLCAESLSVGQLGETPGLEAVACQSG